MALQKISHKKTCLKNGVEAEIEQAVVDFAIEQPAYGHLRVSHQLKQQSSFGSPGGIRSFGCVTTLKALPNGSKHLKPKQPQDNLILTEARLLVTLLSPKD